MNIFLLGDRQQKNEVVQTSIVRGSSLSFTYSEDKLPESPDHDVYLILGEWHALDLSALQHKPVLINSVTDTLAGGKLPHHSCRINGWRGFLERPLWEAATADPAAYESVFAALGRKAVFMKDEPGFVSARVISMIVNEAFYAMDEKISTIEEIDCAMKLGTNYPQGPFEWAEKLGIENLYRLLHQLAGSDDRYVPAPALTKLYDEISKTV